MIFSKLKQWSARRKTAAASSLVVCLLLAGVVTVAVLRSPVEDLQNTCFAASPAGSMAAGERELACSSGRHCGEVEIHDPHLSAADMLGLNAGFRGSDYGCIPVCVWHNDGDRLVGPGGSHALPPHSRQHRD